MTDTASTLPQRYRFGRYKASVSTHTAGGRDPVKGRRRITLRIDDELFESLKRLALRRNKSITAMVRALIEMQVLPR